jgi:hypothetical protein
MCMCMCGPNTSCSGPAQAAALVHAPIAKEQKGLSERRWGQYESSVGNWKKAKVDKRRQNWFRKNIQEEKREKRKGKQQALIRLVRHCPCCSTHERYVRTSSVTAPHHQEVSPKGAIINLKRAIYSNDSNVSHCVSLCCPADAVGTFRVLRGCYGRAKR